jgi:hypothetical protein
MKSRPWRSIAARSGSLRRESALSQEKLDLWFRSDSTPTATTASSPRAQPTKRPIPTETPSPAMSKPAVRITTPSRRRPGRREPIVIGCSVRAGERPPERPPFGTLSGTLLTRTKWGVVAQLPFRAVRGAKVRILSTWVRESSAPCVRHGPTGRKRGRPIRNRNENVTPKGLPAALGKRQARGCVDLLEASTGSSAGTVMLLPNCSLKVPLEVFCRRTGRDRPPYCRSFTSPVVFGN